MDPCHVAHHRGRKESLLGRGLVPSLIQCLTHSPTHLLTHYQCVACPRLYIAAVDDVRRRSCQTVLRIALEALAAAMAPILPHMAEDIWQNLPYQKPSQSVFQTGG